MRKRECSRGGGGGDVCLAVKINDVTIFSQDKLQIMQYAIDKGYGLWSFVLYISLTIS